MILRTLAIKLKYQGADCQKENLGVWLGRRGRRESLLFVKKSRYIHYWL